MMPEPYFLDELSAIYHGEARDVMRRLEPESFDLLLADPPYSSGGLMRSDRNQRTSTKYQFSDVGAHLPDFTGDNRDQRSLTLWVSFWLDEAARLLRNGAAAIVFVDWRNLAAMIDAVQVSGLVYRGVIGWDKTEAARPLLGWFRSQMEFAVTATNGPISRNNEADGIANTGLFTCPAPRDRVHVTQKPVELLKAIIGTRDEWRRIIDPFMGSGSTLVAAKEMGRFCCGIDIDEHWCKIARDRLRQGVLFSGSLPRGIR